jgi:hypothetical protein
MTTATDILQIVQASGSSNDPSLWPQRPLNITSIVGRKSPTSGPLRGIIQSKVSEGKLYANLISNYPTDCHIRKFYQTSSFHAGKV